MVPVKTNSNWLPSIFNDFFENEWLAKRELRLLPSMSLRMTRTTRLKWRLPE